MTDRRDDQIRDLLSRAMDDSPAPHPWAEVERRAGPAAPTTRRRTGVLLASAASVVALVVGLVVVVAVTDDEPNVPVDPTQSTSTTTSPTTTTTTVPPTTTDAPDVGAAGWTGGLLDELDPAALRPLGSVADGDAVLPTGPTGWRVATSAWVGPDDAVAPDFVEWTVEVIEAPPDNGFGQVLYLTQSREPTCTSTLGCVTSGESITIGGVVWEEIVVEQIPDDDPQFFDSTTLRAQVGDRWLALAAGAPQLLTDVMLDTPAVVEFLEGLRIGAPEELAAIGEACWQCVAEGAEGDPFAAGSGGLALPPSDEIESEGEEGIGRPLTELADGDVLLPTYVPPGMALDDTARVFEHATTDTEFSVGLEPIDGDSPASVRLWSSGSPAPTSRSPGDDDPNHPLVEIAGLTWEWNDFETARIADVGSFSVWVYLRGLDRLEAQSFVEGLRAVSLDEYPGTITIDGPDGISVVGDDDADEPAVVATDEEFELTAVAVGDEVCTKLEQTTVPVRFQFAGDCQPATRYEESGMVDLWSIDPTDTEHLVLGVVATPGATTVRVTAPDGASVVVDVGPPNEVIEGRFFLARMTLDVSDGIRLDRFMIEQAGP